jgi:hypothetical protein
MPDPTLKKSPVVDGSLRTIKLSSTDDVKTE